jgi:upstream activation factor subunit UAF30
VTSELRDKYIDIIDDILAQSDLTTISEKRIRKGLQDAVGYDLTPMKVSQVTAIYGASLFRVYTA